MSYEAKSSKVEARQLKVQTLSIPFDITYHATPASVVHKNDEPSVLFIQTEGNDKISAEVSVLADTATYSASPVDANGVCHFYINLGGEVCKKVISAYVQERDNGAQQPCYVGSATGISTLGNIMLDMDSATSLAATSMAGCLVVKYEVTK
jgi:hypothetical protein